MANPSDEIVQQRFAEICVYALEVLGGSGSRLASQRELAEAICVAPTMLTRYLHSGCDWYSLKARTVAALARVTHMEPGSLFVWIEAGREAAMEHQRSLGSTPLTTTVDLAEQLLARLREDAKQQLTANGPDYAGLIALIEKERSAGDILFDRLTQGLGCSGALAAAMEKKELSDEDWTMLSRLLDCDLRAYRFPRLIQAP